MLNFVFDNGSAYSFNKGYSYSNFPIFHPFYCLSSTYQIKSHKRYFKKWILIKFLRLWYFHFTLYLNIDINMLHEIVKNKLYSQTKLMFIISINRLFQLQKHKIIGKSRHISRASCRFKLSNNSSPILTRPSLVWKSNIKTFCIGVGNDDNIVL